MKQLFTKVRLAVIAVIGLFSANINAQVFTQTTPYDTIWTTPGVLNWNILTPSLGAYGNATLTVYYDGDFGASSEIITIYDENNNVIGTTQPYFDGTDCMLDSVNIIIPGSSINSWGAGGDTIKFSGVTSNAVDLFCTNNRARVKLTYNYCPSGVYASLSIGATTFCNIDNAVNLTTSPAGGVLTGTGVTGNQFDPEGIAPGQYPISYTYTDNASCTSVSTVNITIKPSPSLSTATPVVCPGSTATLTASGSGNFVWYADAALTTVLDSGNSFTTGSLTTDTVFYGAHTYYDRYFKVNSITGTNSLVVDHDMITGDDKGGIAVSNNYVYVVGDDSTARYDLSLQNGINLPERDALLSDLGTGNLYTLYNPIVGIPSEDMITSFYVTQIRSLNDTLELGGGVITLSDSIPFGYDNNYELSGIFPGNGFTILYSSITKTWYHVSLANGLVTNLGTSTSSDLYYSENWAGWGVAEYDNTGYSVLYRSDSNNQTIARRSFSTQSTSVVSTFTDISDLASFTVSPSTNRWYFHYEGSGEFGGSSETLGYADMTDSLGTFVRGDVIDCPAAVSVTMDICTGIEESPVANFELMPNPNTGNFAITLSNMKDAKIEVISLDGRVINAQIAGNGDRINFNMTDIANGIYFVRVSNSENTIIKKFIKH